MTIGEIRPFINCDVDVRESEKSIFRGSILDMPTIYLNYRINNMKAVNSEPKEGVLVFGVHA